MSNCNCAKKYTAPEIPWTPYQHPEVLNVTDTACGEGYCGVPSRNVGYGDCNPSQTIPEKLIFIVEWYDNGPDLIKKYMLIYYGVDETCEIKDLINNQRFLRRLKLDTVTLPQLCLGNVLNIYGRQITIKQYGDSCTQQYLESKTQKAFLLIKPEAVHNLGRILQTIEKQFRVLRARMAGMASSFSESNNDPGSQGSQHLTSQPVVALLLVGENAIQKLLGMAGDLRAKFGKDADMNGIHVSENPASVEKDSSVYFTECRRLLPTLAHGTANLQCSTCCIIKPHAVQKGLAGAIIADISAAGYKITAFELFYMDRSHAEEFYEIYKTVVPEYSSMTCQLALGPCYALEIAGRGRDTQDCFREFAGPRDPTLARKLRPQSLRAKYGISTVENAVHCSDLPDDAEMEVDYFFRIMQMI